VQIKQIADTFLGTFREINGEKMEMSIANDIIKPIKPVKRILGKSVKKSKKKQIYTEDVIYEIPVLVSLCGL